MTELPVGKDKIRRMLRRFAAEFVVLLDVLVSATAEFQTNQSSQIHFVKL